MATSLVLLAERPVAGGLTLARHAGRVVLISGAIPAELVRARIDRSTKQVIFASTVEVLEPSPFRRAPLGDQACGGLAYAHVNYDHQLALKTEVFTDTFRRLGKITLEHPLAIAPSPEQAYRLRARLHVRRGQAGFFREGTHDLCDPAPSRQLSNAMLESTRALIRSLGRQADVCDAVTVAENVAGDERVAHLEPFAGGKADFLGEGLALPDGLTGVTLLRADELRTLAGCPHVRDRVDQLCGPSTGLPEALGWSRTAASFFQGNRYLCGKLLAEVLAQAEGDRVLDLYSGVGLFATALAARGAQVIAVEGDPVSGADLRINAAAWASNVAVQQTSVEAAVASMARGSAAVVVIDPPRTGMSPEARAEVIRLAPPRIVYVSCDIATLARDAAQLIAAGYRLSASEGFDMFPNTPHIEVVCVFDRPAG